MEFCPNITEKLTKNCSQHIEMFDEQQKKKAFSEATF